jgi:hypothetical protein
MTCTCRTHRRQRRAVAVQRAIPRRPRTPVHGLDLPHHSRGRRVVRTRLVHWHDDLARSLQGDESEWSRDLESLPFLASRRVGRPVPALDGSGLCAVPQYDLLSCASCLLVIADTTGQLARRQAGRKSYTTLRQKLSSRSRRRTLASSTSTMATWSWSKVAVARSRCPLRSARLALAMSSSRSTTVRQVRRAGTAGKSDLELRTSSPKARGISFPSSRLSRSVRSFARL